MTDVILLLALSALIGFAIGTSFSLFAIAASSRPANLETVPQ